MTDERVRALVTAEDVPAAWAGLPLLERRKIIKATFNVRIQQTQNRGQSAFEPRAGTHRAPRTLKDVGLDAETVRMPGGSGGVAAEELVADQLGPLGTHGGLDARSGVTLT